MEHWTTVPNASALLADWGADVIKVEPPTGEHFRVSQTGIKLGDVKVDPSFQFLNRNKRSLAVDLKRESGWDILCQA